MADEPVREFSKQLCRLPKGGHGRVKRLLGTGAGIIFKGSGFYTTDYRSDSYKKAAKMESPATSAPEKSGEPSKTEKRPYHQQPLPQARQKRNRPHGPADFARMSARKQTGHPVLPL